MPITELKACLSRLQIVNATLTSGEGKSAEIRDSSVVTRGLEEGGISNGVQWRKEHAICPS